jgi:hypothetical protein
MLYLAFMDLTKHLKLKGEIIRLRAFEQGNDKVIYFLALDDGRAEKITAWRISAQLYNSFEQGAEVEAVVSRRLGYVHKMTGVAEANAEEQTPSLAR